MDCGGGMATVDKNGAELKVGDEITVRLRIVDIAGEEAGANISAVTVIPHGDAKKVYALPCVHGSQVEKAGQS